MTKYSDKKIICVKGLSSNVIEEAIFILKSNVVNNEFAPIEESRSREIILSEAEEIIEEYVQKIQDGEEVEKNNIQGKIKEVILVIGILIILGICIAMVMG